MHATRDKGGRRSVSTTVLAVIIVVVIVAVVAGVFVATYHPTKVITITYYDDLSPTEAQVFETKILPEFEKTHPNVKIDYIDASASEIASDVEALVQANKREPVIIGEDNMVIGELIYGGYLLNLTPYMNELLSNVSLIPSMKSIVEYETQVFHAIYFVPLRANVPLVFYNATLFKKLGISPPQNWSELLYDAELIYNKTGIKPVMFQGHGGASTATELYQWMVQAGGNPLLFNDSGDVYAFEFLYNLSQYFSPDYIHGYWGSYKGLLEGTYFILDYQWPYIWSTYIVPAGAQNNISFYPGPSGPVNNDHLVGGDVLAIPKTATHIHTLLEFAQFLLSPQVQRQFIELLSWPAVNELAYQNLPSNISGIYTALEQALEHPFFRLPVAWQTEWNTLADEAFTKIIIDHAPYSQIPSILSYYNQQMYDYLKTTYNVTVAQEYEEGYFAPLYVP